MLAMKTDVPFLIPLLWGIISVLLRNTGLLLL